MPKGSRVAIDGLARFISWLEAIGSHAPTSLRNFSTIDFSCDVQELAYGDALASQDIKRWNDLLESDCTRLSFINASDKQYAKNQFVPHAWSKKSYASLRSCSRKNWGWGWTMNLITYFGRLRWLTSWYSMFTWIPRSLIGLPVNCAGWCSNVYSKACERSAKLRTE